MVQFASYLRRVLCKTRLIFPRINGPIVIDRDVSHANYWSSLGLRPAVSVTKVAIKNKKERKNVKKK